jgi:hypothetical protein
MEEAEESREETSWVKLFVRARLNFGRNENLHFHQYYIQFRPIELGASRMIL